MDWRMERVMAGEWTASSRPFVTEYRGVCLACRTRIAQGELIIKVFRLRDGPTVHAVMHPECADARGIPRYIAKRPAR